MARFLDLPAEIRNMIYRYCLVKNHTLIPYKEHYPLSKADLAFRKDLPAVALLQVCKTIEAEAAAVLYGQNVWRITSKVIYRVDPWYEELEDSVWVRRAIIFKHVVLVFDQQDVDREELYESTTFFNRVHSDIEADGHIPGHGDRLGFMHFRGEVITEDSWERKFNLAQEMKNLASIIFDFSRLFCSVGCCRRQPLLNLLGNLLDTFGGAQKLVDTGLKVQMKGIREEEWNEVLREIKWSQTVVERFTIIHTDSRSRP